jgi:hypothetical protein
MVFDGTAWDRWDRSVTVASLPLPSGAATLAEQQTQTTALQLIDNLPVAQGSTTSGQSGVLIQGAVTTAAPTYTTAQTSPISLQTDGSQRVAVTNTPTVTANAGAGTFATDPTDEDTRVLGRTKVHDGTDTLLITAAGAALVDGSATTQPVSGTVTANAGTNLNTSALALDATLTGRLPAGSTPADNESNVVTTTRAGAYNYVFDGATWDRWTGLVTLAANQSVNLTQLAGNAISTGNGVSGTGVARVAQVSDGTGVLAAVTNVATIGTSVTPGTAAANLGKAEDAASASADTGVAILMVRKDTNAVLTSADGDYVATAADNYGVQSVSWRHPNAIRCTISSTATTSTLVTGCAAPGAGLSIYITSIAWSSSIISTTVNFMRIQSGTGGTCGVSTDVLYDGYTAAAFGGAGFLTATPIKVQANEEVCFVHAAAGTRLVNMTGFIAQ